jgi:hypothetical protein
VFVVTLNSEIASTEGASSSNEEPFSERVCEAPSSRTFTIEKTT